MRTKYNGQKKNGRGRPSSYRSEYAVQAKRIVSTMGCSNPELAQALGISRSSVEKWMRDFPDFKSAVKEGRDAYDTRRVERTCLERALGFEYEEVTTKQITIKQGKGEDAVELPATETTRTKKFLPGDRTLLMFWLQNRQADRWKNVQRTIIEGKVDHTHEDRSVDYSKLSKEELFIVREKLLKALSEKRRAEEQTTMSEPVMN